MISRLKFHRLTPQTATASAMVGILLLLNGGCGEAIQNSHEDDTFIRLPGESAEANLKSNSGPLLPVKTGSVWRNAVTVQRISGPADGNQDPNVDDKGNPFLKTYEKSTSRAAVSAGKGSEVRIDMQREGIGVPNRSEVYAVTNRGIYLSRIEGELPLTVLPPLPLISYPIREHEIKTWSGTIRLSNKTYPAQGYSRVGSLEQVDLPQGKVTARKVDSIITTTINGRMTSFPMKRWFAPGIGMVRQKFISGNLEITKNVVQYKL